MLKTRWLVLIALLSLNYASVAKSPREASQSPAVSEAKSSAALPSSQTGIDSPPKKSSNKNKSQLSAADQKLMDDLDSGNMYRIRTAAKYLYRRRHESPAVVDHAAEVLKNNYNNHYKDPVQVDAMAWICKALWVSRDARYIPLLHEVGQEAKSRKVRKYAIKYHAALVRDTQ
jgi:hypothetical protein